MDLCACSYIANDPDVVDFFDILMTKMLMFVENGGDIFLTL